MRALRWILVMVAVMTLVVAPLSAAEKPANEKAAKEGKAGAGLKGEYAIMTSELKLTEEQQTQIKAKLEARDTAIKAFETANAEKMAALQEAAKKARESGDKDAMKKASTDLKPLTEERAKIQSQSIAEIDALLTPEQRSQWASFRAYRALMGRYAKAELSDDQKAKVREAAVAAAKEVAAVQGDDKVAAKARAEIDAKLRENIEQNILTADQRAKLTQKKEAAPATEKPKAEK